MANTKEYKIVINGLSESINAVESLNRQLDSLEQRMNKINASKVSGGGSTSTRANVSALSEEEAVQREINKLKKEGETLDAKRMAAQDDEYQKVLAMKDLYKETIQDQKTIAAQERLTANAYSNTMAGMKQQLADLKAVINTTDIGDSDKIKQMTQRAGELTKKLKEMEEAYGQFGRNVGNYQSAFEGIDKLTVQVGEVAREFGSAREAGRTLREELYALEMQGKGNTEEANNLRKAYYKLQSVMEDATKTSKAMDEAMDWMQSFGGMASIGNGFKAFFGFDDNEITKSIQKLVALQNVLNGLEILRKQMETGEGIGKILTRGNDAVDKFVANLTGAEITVNGLAKGSRVATIAVRSLSIAMKTLGIGLITAAITGLVTLVEKAGTAIQGYFKGNAELVNTSNIVKSSIEAENNALQKQRDILASKFMSGYINETEYARQNMIALTEAIEDNINAIDMQASLFSKATDEMESFKQSLIYGFENGTFNVSSDFLDMTAVIKNIDGAKAAWKEFARAVEKGEDVITATGARSVSEWLASFIISADDAKDNLVSIGQIIAGDWIRNMQGINTATDEGKRKLRELVDELDNDEVTHSIMMNLDSYFPDEKLIGKIQNVIKYARELNDAFQFDAEESQKGVEYWTQVRIDGMKDGAAKIRAQIKFNHDKELAELTKYGDITAEHRKQLDAKYNRQLQEQLKAVNQQEVAAQNDLARLKIDAMREGLKKQIAQLNQERKEKIQKVVQDGRLVGERTAAINALYDKKILDEKKKWAAEIMKTYDDLYANIQQINRATFNMEADNASMNVQNRTAKNKLNVGYDIINSTTFDNSKVLEEYYKKVLEIEKKAADMEAQIDQERLDKELEYSKAEEELRHKRVADANGGELIQQLEQGKITQEEYDSLMEDEKNAHYSRMNALDKEYAAQSEQTTQQHLETEQNLYNNYYGSIIGDIKKDKQVIDEIMSKQPETDTAGWDVVLAIKVKKTYRTVLSQYESLKNNIIQKQKELEIALKEGRISPEDFALRENELKQEVKAIDNAIKQIKDKQKQLVSDFVQSINPYIQAAMESFQTIMSAVWDAEDTAFDKEQEQLDKYNDELDKALDKQQDIVQEHKSAIDDIESELASARGDRRDELIEKLNAEIAAEKAAERERQRIEKEKEKAQKRQDALDLKRKKAQYSRDMLQAVVNGAMAVTYAAMNAYPIPAIPMMALAASTTAAQLAIMAANKPYAKGGLLEGKSHAQGGIPIPGTGIEVEGKEYVVRKKSTAQNIDLLDYINKSERKLSLEDFIDFYGSKVRRNVTSMSPGRKYADGGSLPTITNNYEFDDRLLSAFEDYSNRQVVVSVVDINNRQEAVKTVQVLAGLNE